MAQTKPLTGFVLDSLNRPIAYANVVAINQSTQKIAGFGISNNEGKFKVTLLEGPSYLIRVSFVGYRQYEQALNTWDSDTPQLVILKQSDTQLGLVEVVSEMPVTMKGDTLTYKTDAFTTGTERKLEDVLEKLPGFQVDEEGGVKVQGKTVDKVLIDGKPFMDGDTKLATKNLPANAVDRVQVLKNFNEVGPMRGLDTNETLALNIQLKDGKKNMVFGDLTAGVGPQKRYLAHANTFYYAPKLNVNFIGGTNNVGEQPFTLSGLFPIFGRHGRTCYSCWIPRTGQWGGFGNSNGYPLQCQFARNKLSSLQSQLYPIRQVEAYGLCYRFHVKQRLGKFFPAHLLEYRTKQQRRTLVFL